MSSDNEYKTEPAPRNTALQGMSEMPAKRPRRRLPGTLLAVVAVAAVTFTLGLAIGDGRIALGNQRDSSLPGQLDYSSIDQVYNVLRQSYDGKLDERQLLDGMKEGLAEATGDPYTEYFSAASYKEFNDQLNGAGFSGIGAELGQDKDKNLIVVAPIAGTPAAAAGVKPRDIIAEINGQATTGLSVEEAVGKIRGKKGTSVKLTLVRDRSESIELEITRDDIRVPSVESKMLEGNVGYMKISTFGEDTGSVAERQARELKDQGATSVVLDLRGNPGGVVDASIDVASLWLPRSKLVMQEKRGATVIKTYTSNGSATFAGLPTAVLINEGSASASEIVAGALKDNNAAQLIGEKSYGKGVVQGIEPLGDGSQLKVTVARWYRPNGQNIDKKGINPDRQVTLSDADSESGADPQLEAALAAVRR